MAALWPCMSGIIFSSRFISFHVCVLSLHRVAPCRSWLSLCVSWWPSESRGSRHEIIQVGAEGVCVNGFRLDKGQKVHWSGLTCGHVFRQETFSGIKVLRGSSAELLPLEIPIQHCKTLKSINKWSVLTLKEVRHLHVVISVDVSQSYTIICVFLILSCILHKLRKAVIYHVESENTETEGRVTATFKTSAQSMKCSN